MKLELFRSLWTNGFDLEAALIDCHEGLFTGVEGPVPASREAGLAFCARLQQSGVPYIAEIATGGGYVPVEKTPARHLDEFLRKADAAVDCRPRFLTVLAGCDAWPLAVTVDVFGRMIAAARERNIVVTFETHRSRPTFTPWATRELLAQLPGLRLTCDFSHWCCVCERFVLDEEAELLGELGRAVHHIHGRVGYEQGPQVPHPAAPEFQPALAAHQRWWLALWRAQQQRGCGTVTMTPEFGPDGYLQAAPFTRTPAADLDEVNRWMAAHLLKKFAEREALPFAEVLS